MKARPWRRPLLALLIVFGSAAAAAGKERLDLARTTLRLPGAPAVILPADLDGDGLRDLVVAVAYTEWDQINIDEISEMRGVEGLVMVMTVVPVVMDRREIRVFRGLPEGGYAADVEPLPIDLSVLSLDHGPPSAPVLLLTDSGLSALRLEATAGGYDLRLESVAGNRPVMAGSGTLVPNLGLGRELDGDGLIDLLLPVGRGIDVYRGASLGAAWVASQRVVIPGDRTRARETLERYYPLPVVRDVNGDGLADLLVPDRERDWDRFAVLLNRGGGEFDEAISPLRAVGDDEESFPVVHFGDLDGDGVAEYVTEEVLDDADAGWRKEIKEAKRPPRRYRIHRSEADLDIHQEPYQTFEALGYAFDVSDADIQLPGGFQDLDGDGRQDLITLTLDFSLFQAIRIMTTQRIGIGLDFHIFCQGSGGRFQEVVGMDLSGKFKLDLNNLQLGQLSQFAGDFDGDGRVDFLQIGRGRTVTIHRGQEGCRYPSAPDLTLKLDEPPLDLGLVRVDDFDSDGRSDLLIVQPDRQPEPGITPPVLLDLYLSRGPR